VGVNASHGKLRSPIFEDGSFEFIPIPEKGRWHSCVDCPTLPRYCDLISNNNNDLLEFVPERYHRSRVHNDPEFTSYTYGDYPTKSPRAANLKRLKTGDFIFFLARLVKWKDGAFTDEAGFYLVGFFQVKNIIREVERKPEPSVLEEFVNSAHMQRALYDCRFWNRFWVFKGSPRSRRFRYAIRFTKSFAENVLTTAKGERIKWDRNRTQLQVIGSYTRACRIIDDEKRLSTFWKHVCEQ